MFNLTISLVYKKSLDDNWLEKLETTLARMKKEVEKRNSAKILEEQRREKLLEEKKKIR